MIVILKWKKSSTGRSLKAFAGDKAVGAVRITDNGNSVWFLFPGDNENGKSGRVDTVEQAKDAVTKAFSAWLEGMRAYGDVVGMPADIWRVMCAHGIDFSKGRGEVMAVSDGEPVIPLAPDNHEISSVADLAACITSRRVALDASTDMVDEAAGLTHRQVQKIEDSGRGFAESQRSTRQDLAALMLRFSETGMNEEIAHTLRFVAEGALRAVDRAKDKPMTARVPSFDTALLAIQALGGKLKIEWGEVPPIMKSLKIAPREQAGKK